MPRYQIVLYINEVFDAEAEADSEDEAYDLVYDRWLNRMSDSRVTINETTAAVDNYDATLIEEEQTA